MIVNDLLEALETWDGDTQVLVLDKQGVGRDLQFVETYESNEGRVLLLIPGECPTVTVTTLRHEEIKRAVGSYSHFRVLEVAPQFILIRDVGPWNLFPTVTNDAEGVVFRLASILDGRRLFYFDSEGELRELKIVNGKFAGFHPCLAVPRKVGR